jgi:hypothetical protein
MAAVGGLGEALLALHPGASGGQSAIQRFLAAAVEPTRSVDGEGPAEPGLAAELARDLPRNGDRCILLWDYLRRSFCGGYLGNDSGISHLRLLWVAGGWIFGPDAGTMGAVRSVCGSPAMPQPPPATRARRAAAWRISHRGNNEKERRSPTGRIP